MLASTLIFKLALQFLILVPASSKILKHSASRHCVPEPLSAFFLSFFQRRETRHGWHVRVAIGGGKTISPFHSSLTLWHSYFSINTTMVFKAKGGKIEREIGREKLVERSRSLGRKFSWSKTLPLKFLKPLKVEKSHPSLSLEPRFGKPLHLSSS